MELSRQVRLLVVDDQPEYFSQLFECAELCSYSLRVECKYADSEGLLKELLGNWHPTVVVLDIHASFVPSFELVSRLQHDAIPVVVTSASHSKDIERAAASHGAIAYVQKTDDPEELERTLQALASISTSLDNPN